MNVDLDWSRIKKEKEWKEEHVIQFNPYEICQN